MRIEVKKGGERVLLIPQNPIDHFHIGLIHGRLSSIAVIKGDNADNSEPTVESLDISIGVLIHGLLGRGKPK